MPSTTRRYLLRVGCLAAMGSVAGCTDITPNSTNETRLTFLLFHNLTDEPHSVAVRIEDGTTVYEETITMQPNSSDLLPPDTVRQGGYPTDPGGYEVAFELEDRSAKEGRADFDLGTVDEDCVGYTVEIQTAQSVDVPQMNVFPNTGCDQGRMGNGTN